MFGNGVSEAEIAGKPMAGVSEAARSFVGIAFRLQDDLQTYDAFYPRPTNDRAEDQARRNQPHRDARRGLRRGAVRAVSRPCCGLGTLRTLRQESVLAATNLPRLPSATRKRVLAVSGLRRSAPLVLRFGDFVVDRDARQLFRGGIQLHRPPTALELLDALVGARPTP